MQHRSRGPFWCDCGAELCNIGLGAHFVVSVTQNYATSIAVRAHFGVGVGRNYVTSVSEPIFKGVWGVKMAFQAESFSCELQLPEKL